MKTETMEINFGNVDEDTAIKLATVANALADNGAPENFIREVINEMLALNGKEPLPEAE